MPYFYSVVWCGEKLESLKKFRIAILPFMHRHQYTHYDETRTRVWHRAYENDIICWFRFQSDNRRFVDVFKKNIASLTMRSWDRIFLYLMSSLHCKDCSDGASILMTNSLILDVYVMLATLMLSFFFICYCRLLDILASKTFAFLFSQCGS